MVITRCWNSISLCPTSPYADTLRDAVSEHQTQRNQPVRLDKWLWAARFFKTRSLANQAIGSGKVLVEGVRPKPARHIALGETLSIRIGAFEHVVVVKGLSSQRGPARVAAELYEETPESRQRREDTAARLKFEREALPHPQKRPNKQERRQIIRFTRSGDGGQD